MIITTWAGSIVLSCGPPSAITTYSLCRPPRWKPSAWSPSKHKPAAYPVLYQPVPGLTDVLSDTALQTDFTRPAALASTLKTLKHDRGARAELSTAGLANARRFPISSTAQALSRLGAQIT